MPQGYWMLVLHSHLPYVKHPEYEYFLEEHWLFEAINETYIPLLMRLKNLEDEGVYCRITTSVTPPLAEMLSDGHLMEKYERHIDKMLELTEKEIIRTENDANFAPLAKMYNNRFKQLKDFYTGFLNRDILSGYRYFEDKGMIETITCGFTHGFLPLLNDQPNAVRAQIETAVNTHKKRLGRSPKGIWLPECAYFEGLENILNDYGIKYFFVDTHGVLYSKPRPRYGVYAPVYTKSGVAAFGRDYFSSKQVWSSKEGYPGDLYYRDFYRDIGWDLDYEYVKPYIDPNGTRVFTGVKYHRVTGDSNYKEAYQPGVAYGKTVEHAKHFVAQREEQIKELAELMDRKPLVTSPYDAELFGHWWYEGIDFIYNLYREMDKSEVVKAITPSEYLNEFSTNQMVEVNPSSWGDKGYYDVWLNGGNNWIYRHLHFMAERLVNLSKSHYSVHGIEERTLNQMARELFLAQSSDWAFLITTETATDYAVRRTKEHIHNFLRLLKMVDEKDIDEHFLKGLEDKNSIFPDMDFRIYS